jgi:hypothetical protein
MGTAARRVCSCAAGGFVLLSAGCAGPGAARVQVATPAPPPVATTTSGPASDSTTTTGLAKTTAGTPQTTEAAPAEGTCGTVTAASGLTLQVLDSPGVPCADAKQLVSRFQARLAGRQPAGSGQPASATVDGWLCVSGPPSSQGGTTCSLQDRTVFAGVAAE